MAYNLRPRPTIRTPRYAEYQEDPTPLVRKRPAPNDPDFLPCDSASVACRSAITRGGRLIGPAPEPHQRGLHWSCAQGHSWLAAPSRVARGSWCPHCRASKAEAAARAYLHDRLGPASLDRRPAWTRTAMSRRGLELDIYYPDRGFAVEVQGVQHLKQVKWFHPTDADFAGQIARDVLKQNLCLREGVDLLEILPGDDIPAVLEAFLTARGL